jgi:hypothetical protein
MSEKFDKFDENSKLAQEKFGLNSENRNFLTGLIFVLLLLFGPVDPYGIAIRFGYLIFIPVLVFSLLKHFGGSWKMDKVSNDYLNRAIFACIAGALLVSVYLSMTTKYHTECDKYVQTRDGQECVGDYVTVKGPDKGVAFIEVIFAGFAIWYAIAKRKEGDL